MALKRSLKKEDYDKLSKDIKEHYTEQDGNYVLDTDGDDATTLLRAKEHEKAERKRLQSELKKLQEEHAAVVEERDNILAGAIPKADVEKLKGSYESKLAKREKELNERIASHEQSLSSMLVDNVAQSLASKISTAPNLLVPHIKSRLRANLADGKPSTQILDANGQPSALTVADLEKEILANKEFAPIIAASKASGGGANGASNGGGATGKKTMARSDFSALSPTDQRQFVVVEKGTVTD